MKKITTTLTDEELLNAGRAMERKGFNDFGAFLKDTLLKQASETLAKEEK
jgi:hypothetical protein